MTSSRNRPPIIRPPRPGVNEEHRPGPFPTWPALRAAKATGVDTPAYAASSLKMTAPRYQEVNAVEIPEVTDDDGTRARVVCGSFWGNKGPVDGIDDYLCGEERRAAEVHPRPQRG
jgi:redox-sensitive bicupin YhaK (pirin superfamily)